jgi:hypothetical protein
MNSAGLLALVACLGIAAAPALGQEPPTPPIAAPGVTADTVVVARIPSPRGAFLRSLAVPGWGQLHVGAPRRAAVFIGLQATSYAMLAQSIRRLDSIRQDEIMRMAPVRDSILVAARTDTALARRIEDPFVLDELIGTNPNVASARALVRARTQHRQDWIAYTIAFTMASAMDAYVAAHLANFPAAIEAEPRPGGGVSLQFSVPVGRRP